MLTVRQLCFAFGSRLLFRDVSFAVSPGQLVRIAGPNGSGKSTLLSLVAGLMDGASGEIDYEGSDDPRAWTAWIPADANALNPHLSAATNLEFWQELRGAVVGEQELATALEYWGLRGTYIQRQLPVGVFSTGMKRRLALARLTLSQAKLWLLDEPLFGLDDHACSKFRNCLKSHLAAGGAALVITHDERLVEGIPLLTISLGEMH